MAWFKRWRNKMRNYTSGSDYPGSYGGGGGGGSASQTQARFEVEAVRFKDTMGPTN
jgi:hypothetical protein